MGYIHHVVDRTKEFAANEVSSHFILEAEEGKNFIYTKDTTNYLFSNALLNEPLKNPKGTVLDFIAHFSTSPLVYDDRYIDIYYDSVIPLRTSIHAKKLISLTKLDKDIVGFALYEGIVNPLHPFKKITSLDEIKENPIVVEGKDKEKIFIETPYISVKMTEVYFEEKFVKLLDARLDILDYYRFAPYITRNLQ